MSTRKKKTVVSKRQLYRRVAAAKFDLVSDVTEQNFNNTQQSKNIIENSNNYCSLDEFCNELPLNNSFSSENYGTFDDKVLNNLPSNNYYSNEPLSFESVPPPDNDVYDDLPCNNNNLVRDFTQISNSLSKELSHWATKRYVRRAAVTHLLHILHPYHSNLPLDSRTLLKTPRQTTIKNLVNGEYCHFGLIDSLKLKLTSLSNISRHETIYISFNVDGLPIFHKGHRLQLWPILALIKNFKTEPFVVGSFLGEGKPNPLSSYLKDFLEELMDLLSSGIQINNHFHTVKVHSFVCDAPARAYLKCVKQHSGYSSCDRCEDYGEYHGRIIFRNSSAKRRDDTSFRTQNDKNYHHEESPLLCLPIDMIYSFPIDYMHEVCLGVMKKLLKIWTGKPSNAKLRCTTVRSISENIINLSKFIPVEFNRKGCDLAYLADWKATEFRLFLLYTGPIVLLDEIDLAIYEHFMLFHCSLMIFLSKRHIENIGVDIGRQLLNVFVKHSVQIYSIEFLIYNVHLLLHLADDVEIYGPLDDVSAFPFENYLGHLKSLVQSPKNPLQQIHRRLKEIEMTQYENVDIHFKDTSEYVFPHYSGPVPNFPCRQYKKLRYKNFQFSTFLQSGADCFCRTLDGLVVRIENIVVSNDNKCYILGKRFQTYTSFFKYPIDSKQFDIYRIKDLSQNIEIWSRDEIDSKCIAFPLQQGWVSMPLLHH